jgi:hypothetical protein
MKRIFACLIIVAVFPLLASLTHNKSGNSIPFATIAFAGHVTPGGEYCECGAERCTCDQGERPGGQNYRATPSKSDSPANESSGFDFGSGALLLALALFLWTRLRA